MSQIAYKSWVTLSVSLDLGISMKTWLLVAFCNASLIETRVNSVGTYGWENKFCLKVLEQNIGFRTSLHIDIINSSSSNTVDKEVWKLKIFSIITKRRQYEAKQDAFQ